MRARIGPFRLALICIYVCCLTPANAQTLDYVFNLNRLTISAPEIKIRDGRFLIYLFENGRATVLSPAGDPSVEASAVATPAGVGDLTTYSWSDYRGYTYSWLIKKIGNDMVSIQVRFVNGSLKPVRLQKIVILSTPEGGFTARGNAADWMLSTTDVENRRWGTLDKVIPTSRELRTDGAYSRSYFLRRGEESVKADDRAWRTYFGDAALYREPGRNGISMAAVDTVADLYFDMRVKNTAMKLEVISNMSEILVDPGEARHSEEALFISKPWAEAQKIKNRWIATVSGTTVTKKPIFGWCSWYRSGPSITQEDIYAMTRYVRKHYSKIPLDVIQIDDGWQISKAHWKENEKFSDGFKALTDSIHRSGMVAGIWLSPLRVDAVKSELGKAMRVFPSAWYSKDRNGNYRMNQLDPTHPEARKVMYGALRYCYEQGFRYFKLDFSNIEFDSKMFYNPKLTRFQAQRELFRLFREAVGNESYLLACGIMDQRSLVPFVDADRIGTDTEGPAGFAREPFASDGQPKSIHGFLYPILSIVNKSYENGVLSNADPDVTYTGQAGKCSPEQLRTFHGIVGLSGGAAMISDHLYRKEFDHPGNLRMMEILNPISKEKGAPIAGGWDVYGRIYGYEVDRSYGNAVNAVIWNPEHNKHSDIPIKNIPTAKIGDKFHAWSFWDERYIGVISGKHVVKNIPSYESKLLRLTPVSRTPAFIGSNLHVSMGATGIKNISINATQIEIDLDPNAGARSGRLYFYSRQPLGNVKSTNPDVFILRKQDNIYVVVLTHRERNMEEKITIDIGSGDAMLLSQVLSDPSLKQRYDLSSFTDGWLNSW